MGEGNIKRKIKSNHRQPICSHCECALYMCVKEKKVDALATWLMAAVTDGVLVLVRERVKMCRTGIFFRRLIDLVQAVIGSLAPFVASN